MRYILACRSAVSKDDQKITLRPRRASHPLYSIFLIPHFPVDSNRGILLFILKRTNYV